MTVAAELNSYNLNPLLLLHRLEAQQVCGKLAENSKFVQGELDLGVSSTIKRVRYEEFAMRPDQTTRDIYEFIGKPPGRYLLDWVELATHDERGLSWLQSTTRNARKVVTAWRLWYTFDELSVVQDVCEEPMRLLGYSKLSSKADMVNMDLPSF